MTSILEQLGQDHGNVARLLDLMEAQRRCLSRGEHSDLSLLASIMRYLTQYQDVFHHPREDLLFTRIAARSPSAQSDIEKLESEHLSLGVKGIGLCDAITTSQQDRPVESLAGCLEEYGFLLREHMAYESSNAFPLAQIILSRADWKALDEQFEVGIDPLFGPNVERAYQLVFERFGSQHGS